MKHLLSTSLILTFIAAFAAFAADPVSLGHKILQKMHCMPCDYRRQR